jgi:hypothetical protein
MRSEQKNPNSLDELVLRAYTIWLEKNGKEITEKLDYLELSKWFGQEVGIVVKNAYEQ